VHSSLHSAAIAGAGALPVEVQVDLSLGLPGFHLVGLPDLACNDARVRVLTAIRNSGYQLPQKKITVNLAPGDLPKHGSGFDLAIALGVLGASGVLPPEQPPSALAVGELTLSGNVLPVRGVLPIALEARRLGFTTLIVPEDNACEGALVQGLRVHGARSLAEAAEVWCGTSSSRPAVPSASEATPSPLDLTEVRGQQTAKWALEIAAAGGHNALFIGPPGAGKTMLARRLPGLLPAMSFEEAVEATSIWSVAGRLKANAGLLTARPFRAPHHTISVAGLIGGGSPLRPGEISLAHRGVLFLDELPEFGRAALEALRQPLEDGEVSLVRARDRASMPARFMLLGAMNPCPCGHAADGVPGRCRCTLPAQESYRRRISGPILDRFDLHVEVRQLSSADLLASPEGESSAAVRARVERARGIQRERFRGLAGVYCNAQLGGRSLRRLCDATREATAKLGELIDGMKLSARAHDRILKLARTIADLQGAGPVTDEHVGEAAALRALDRPVAEAPPARESALVIARKVAARKSPGASPGEVPREGA
jgi:magnesium chelatase family protein